MKEEKITIIIPAYNEEKIIQKACKTVLDYFDKNSLKGEVLVVDDGSYDRTTEMVKKLSNANVSLLTFKKNRGKGAALREGFLRADGKYLIFMDADLSVPVKYIHDMLTFLGKYQVVVSSRRTSGAKIKVHQPFLRESMGRVFTFLTRMITNVPVSDFTCGFKGFTNKAAKKIFGNSSIDRWAYDAEVLFLAKKYGFKIKEIPVEWKNREATRVELGSATITSLRDLFYMRLRNILGKYDD